MPSFTQIRLLEDDRWLPRSTYRSTKLGESDRADTISDGLTKPERREENGASPYRTQEVAGSSPASSI